MQEEHPDRNDHIKQMLKEQGISEDDVYWITPENINREYNDERMELMED